MLAERVEPRAHLEGHPRPLRLKGALTGDSLDDWLKGLDGEIGFDLKGAEFYGMHLGPAPVVLHSLEGKLAFDPIDTTINEGRLHLEPTLTLDDQDGAALRLGPESSIKDAAINDEVSHRVLSFVAPVLDQATRVHGNVSVALDEAVFPIGGNAGGGDRRGERPVSGRRIRSWAAGGEARRPDRARPTGRASSWTSRSR